MESNYININLSREITANNHSLIILNRIASATSWIKLIVNRILAMLRCDYIDALADPFNPETEIDGKDNSRPKIKRMNIFNISINEN